MFYKIYQKKFTDASPVFNLLSIRVRRKQRAKYPTQCFTDEYICKAANEIRF